MTKKDLITSVAKEAGITQKDASAAVNAVLDSIATALAAGEKVQLPGFGTFEVRHRNARTGTNPHTKEVINIPASNIPAFKPGKALKDKI